jgi:hypothetical protein
VAKLIMLNIRRKFNFKTIFTINLVIGVSQVRQIPVAMDDSLELFTCRAISKP